MTTSLAISQKASCPSGWMNSTMSFISSLRYIRSLITLSKNQKEDKCKHESSLQPDLKEEQDYLPPPIIAADEDELLQQLKTGVKQSQTQLSQDKATPSHPKSNESGHSASPDIKLSGGKLQKGDASYMIRR
jgi:hypothetical protein